MLKAWHCHMPGSSSPTSSHALASTLQAHTAQCEMADWSTLYLAALDARDRRESTNKSYIDACTSSTPTLTQIIPLTLLRYSSGRPQEHCSHLHDPWSDLCRPFRPNHQRRNHPPTTRPHNHPSRPLNPRNSTPRLPNHQHVPHNLQQYLNPTTHLRTPSTRCSRAQTQRPRRRAQGEEKAC